MVDIDKAILVKINKQGNNLEILVDCEKALEFRQGKNIDLDDIIATNSIFKDVKKGEHAKDLMKFLKTEDFTKISEMIIREGEIQSTSEYKNKLREEKRRRIIEIIHRNAVGPNTNIPHPSTRIKKMPWKR